MSVNSEVSVPSISTKYLIEDSASVLSKIYETDTALTCFCCPSSWAKSNAAIHYVKKAQDSHFQYQGAIDRELFDRIRAMFSSTTHGDLLFEHIELMLAMFEELFEPKEIGLRILPSHYSISPAFHFQNGIVKMMSTLGGSGERWLEKDFVQYHLLEKNQLAPAIKQPKACDVNTLCNGDIALVKGKNWVDQEHNAVVCASPTFDNEESKLCIYIDYIS